MFTPQAVFMVIASRFVAETATILQPKFLSLSPAVGLLARSAPTVVTNLMSMPSAGQRDCEWSSAAALCRELYFQQRAGAPPLVSRSRSHAATHLTSAAAGHILGLGLRPKPDDTVLATLRAQGIESNHVDGKWTGVSLARYRRLIDLLAASPARGMTVPLFLRFVWERAQSKRCLLHFLLALDTHVAVLRPEWRDALTAHDGAAAEEWCRSAFVPSETSAAAVEAAAQRILCSEDSISASRDSISASSSSLPTGSMAASSASRATCPSLARAVEVLAANLGDVHAFKPPNSLERHAVGGGEARPDCVEMVVRELFDLLLYDPMRHAFDPSRLPPGASAALRAHYEQRASGALADHAAGAAWFPLCQGILGCEYLSTAPSGERYEAAPSLSNVSRLAAHLLGVPLGEQPERRWRSLVQIAELWNGHVVQTCADGGAPTALRSLRLEVDESGTGMYRAMLSDHTRRRELARLRLESSRHGVELLLETDPPIAIATHRRLDAAWSEMTMRSHLEAWRSTARPQATSSHLNSQLGHDRRSDPAEVEAGEAAAEAARVAVLRVLWPIVLGDRMLDALPNKASGDCMLLLLEALTSARWADELERLWNPTMEASTAHLAEASQLDAARSRAHERTVRAIEALSALAAAAPSARLGDGDEGRGVAARAWLAWLLERAPETMSQSALIRALLSGSRAGSLAGSSSSGGRGEEGSWSEVHRAGAEGRADARDGTMHLRTFSDAVRHGLRHREDAALVCTLVSYARGEVSLSAACRRVQPESLGSVLRVLRFSCTHSV